MSGAGPIFNTLVITKCGTNVYDDGLEGVAHLICRVCLSIVKNALTKCWNPYPGCLGTYCHLVGIELVALLVTHGSCWCAC